MSSRDREHRSERRKSRKHKSSRHEAQRKDSGKSTPWSEWELEETGGRWYQLRHNEKGNIEFQYQIANAASYNQKEDYATGHESNQRSQTEYEYPETPLRNDGVRYKSEETIFGSSPYTNPNCSCTQNCPVGTGCDVSTTAHAGPVNVKPFSTQPYALTYAVGDRPWSYRVAPTLGTYAEGIFDASSTLEHLGNDRLSSAITALNLEDSSYSKPAQNQHSQQPWQGLHFPYNANFSLRGLPSDWAPVDYQGTSFGRICEELGLLKSKKSGSWQSDSRSLWNPDGLRNNCVCVSVGYIIGMDAKKLAEYLEVEFPPHIKGLGVGEMAWHLGSMPGLNVVILPFDDSDISKIPTNSVSFALQFLKPWIRHYMDRPFAIGYQRDDKSGHCVVVEMSGMSSEAKIDRTLYSYTCYQEKAEGVDMGRDLLKSSIRFAIFADDNAQLLLEKSH